MKIIRRGSLTPVSETPPQKSKMVLQVLFSYLCTLIIFSLVKTLHTAKNWSFPLRISSVNVTKPQIPADLVTFTEEIFNGKFHLLCSFKILSWYFLCAKNKVFHWPVFSTDPFFPGVQKEISGMAWVMPFFSKSEQLIDYCSIGSQNIRIRDINKIQHYFFKYTYARAYVNKFIEIR